jgi:hypothetical protein
LWIRLLQFVIRPGKASRGGTINRPRGQIMVANTVLIFQIIKMIVLRAPGSISKTPGLWNYISNHLSEMVRWRAIISNNDHIIQSTRRGAMAGSDMNLQFPPRTISLDKVEVDPSWSAPSTPGEIGHFSFPPEAEGRLRNPSIRSPSMSDMTVDGAPRNRRRGRVGRSSKSDRRRPNRRIALHRSPLMLEMRHLMRIALDKVEVDPSWSAPSTPGEIGHEGSTSTLSRAMRMRCRISSINGDRWRAIISNNAGNAASHAHRSGQGGSRPLMVCAIDPGRDRSFLGHIGRQL